MDYRIEREPSRHCDCCPWVGEVLLFTISRSKLLRLCLRCWSSIVPNAARIQMDSDPQAAIEVRR